MNKAAFFKKLIGFFRRKPPQPTMGDTLKDFARQGAFWIGMSMITPFFTTPIETKLRKRQMEELARYRRIVQHRYGVDPYGADMMKTSSDRKALYERALVNAEYVQRKSLLHKTAAFAFKPELFLKGLTAGSPVGAMILRSFKLSRANLARFIKLMKKRHPEWDERDILKYVKVVQRYAPELVENPVVLEAVLERVFAYGGVDPMFIKQLAEAAHEARRKGIEWK